MGMILLRNISVGGTVKDMLIEGNLISRVAPVGMVVPQGTEVMDCSGKVALPGLVNMHTHAGMALMRGVGEDIPFHEWLERIWVLEEGLDEEYVYHATKVACL